MKRVKTDGTQAELNNNMSERLQGTLRDRFRSLRRLKSGETGQRYLNGWTFNYGYFLSRMALKSTPATLQVLKRRLPLGRLL